MYYQLCASKINLKSLYFTGKNCIETSNKEFSKKETTNNFSEITHLAESDRDSVCEASFAEVFNKVEAKEEGAENNVGWEASTFTLIQSKNKRSAEKNIKVEAIKKKRQTITENELDNLIAFEQGMDSVNDNPKEKKQSIKRKKRKKTKPKQKKKMSKQTRKAKGAANAQGKRFKKRKSKFGKARKKSRRQLFKKRMRNKKKEKEQVGRTKKSLTFIC